MTVILVKDAVSRLRFGWTGALIFWGQYRVTVVIGVECATTCQLHGFCLHDFTWHIERGEIPQQLVSLVLILHVKGFEQLLLPLFYQIETVFVLGILS